MALRLARDEPQTFTANMAKAQRKGKVYVDYLRNVRGANAVGVYSTRAREGAPVSVPVDWDELDRLSGPDRLHGRGGAAARAGLRIGRRGRPVGAVPRAQAAGARVAHARPLRSERLDPSGRLRPRAC